MWFDDFVSIRTEQYGLYWNHNTDLWRAVQIVGVDFGDNVDILKVHSLKIEIIVNFEIRDLVKDVLMYGVLIYSRENQGYELMHKHVHKTMIHP